MPKPCLWYSYLFVYVCCMLCLLFVVCISCVYILYKLLLFLVFGTNLVFPLLPV